VRARSDGRVLLLDRDNSELHILTGDGALEKTFVLGLAGSLSISPYAPGVVEPTGGLLLNVTGLGADGPLFLNTATSIIRLTPDWRIDRGFGILVNVR
jgi:hypothetical protein